MANCFFWRAERRVVAISEATLVPAAIQPVSPFSHEHLVARSATVAVPLSKYRAVRTTDDRLRPRMLQTLFKQDFELHEVISHLIRSLVGPFAVLDEITLGDAGRTPLPRTGPLGDCRGLQSQESLVGRFIHSYTLGCGPEGAATPSCESVYW